MGHNKPSKSDELLRREWLRKVKEILRKRKRRKREKK